MGETKTVSFKATEEQVKQISQAVDMGNYTSKGEFLRSLLRKELRPELTRETIQRIEEGREQIRNGESTTLEELE